MSQHATGTREERLSARLELLEAGKQLTRRSDEPARQRRDLPWFRHAFPDRHGKLNYGNFGATSRKRESRLLGVNCQADQND